MDLCEGGTVGPPNSCTQKKNLIGGLKEKESLDTAPSVRSMERTYHRSRCTDGTKQTVTSVSPRWIWCATHFSSFVFDPWCPAGPLSASRGCPGSLALLPHYQLICHSNGEQHTRHCAWMGTIWQHLPAHSFPSVETKRETRHSTMSGEGIWTGGSDLSEHMRVVKKQWCLVAAVWNSSQFSQLLLYVLECKDA